MQLYLEYILLVKLNQIIIQILITKSEICLMPKKEKYPFFSPFIPEEWQREHIGIYLMIKK